MCGHLLELVTFYKLWENFALYHYQIQMGGQKLHKEANKVGGQTHTLSNKNKDAWTKSNKKISYTSIITFTYHILKT